MGEITRPVCCRLIAYRIISRSHHHQYMIGLRICDRIAIGLVESTCSTQAHIDDFGAVGHSVIDTRNNGGGRACASCIQHAHRHDICFPAYAHTAFAIIAFSADDTGNMGAMTGEIHRVARCAIGSEIIPVQRVGISGITRPHICSQILRIIVDAGVHHGHQHRAAVGLQIPGRLQVHVIARCTGCRRIATGGNGLPGIFRRP